MKKLIIAVDFDGTCVHNEFPHVGADMFGAELALKRLQADGHHIILWTCREHFAFQGVDDVLQLAIDWFDKRGIKLYAINGNPDSVLKHDYPIARKCSADVYIDDHCLFMPRTPAGDIDWHAVYMEIKRIAEAE